LCRGVFAGTPRYLIPNFVKFNPQSIACVMLVVGGAWVSGVAADLNVCLVAKRKLTHGAGVDVCIDYIVHQQIIRRAQRRSG